MTTATQTLGLPSGLRACLFDLDGVLTKTAQLHARAWKEILDEYLRQTGESFTPFQLVDYTRYVDGKLRRDGALTFLASRGLHPSDEVIERLARDKDERFLELLRSDRIETYPGSIRFVEAVRRARMATAVVSASNHCKDVLESAGISNLFDARVDGVVAAAEHLAGKPAPDTFVAAAHKLGVEPADAAVFEDALAGVDAGRAGDFALVVGIDRAGQADALIEHGADIVVPDLGELLERS